MTWHMRFFDYVTLAFMLCVLSWMWSQIKINRHACHMFKMLGERTKLLDKEFSE